MRHADVAIDVGQDRRRGQVASELFDIHALHNLTGELLIRALLDQLDQLREPANLRRIVLAYFDVIDLVGLGFVAEAWPILNAVGLHQQAALRRLTEVAHHEAFVDLLDQNIDTEQLLWFTRNRQRDVGPADTGRRHTRRTIDLVAKLLFHEGRIEKRSRKIELGTTVQFLLLKSIEVNLERTLRRSSRETKRRVALEAQPRLRERLSIDGHIGLHIRKVVATTLALRRHRVELFASDRQLDLQHVVLSEDRVPERGFGILLRSGTVQGAALRCE